MNFRRTDIVSVFLSADVNVDEALGERECVFIERPISVSGTCALPAETPHSSSSSEQLAPVSYDADSRRNFGCPCFPHRDDISKCIWRYLPDARCPNRASSIHRF